MIEYVSAHYNIFGGLLFTERFDSSTMSKPAMHPLYDHRPLELNTDDYQRVCQIPKRKVFLNVKMFDELFNF